MIKLTTLYEEVTSGDQDAAEMQRAFNMLSAEVDAKLNAEEAEMTEGVSTIIGLLMSGPFIVKLFGKFVSFIEKKIAQFRKQDPSVVGAKILKFADKYHHFIMLPFFKIAKAITDDPGKQKKFANYMFHGIIGILLIQGGVSLTKALMSNSVDITFAAEVAKNGVKSTELVTGIRNMLAGAMAEIGEDVGTYTG